MRWISADTYPRTHARHAPGSIRIPSLCCGLYGFKPTASRVPYGRQAPLGDPGLRTIPASAGPLANDLDALALFMKAVLDARPARLDATALDVPWQLPPIKTTTTTTTTTTETPLRFGLLAEDPIFPLHPPVRRALADAAARLRAAGHDVVPLSAAEGLVAPSYDVATQMFALDRTSAATVLRGGEPFVPSLAAARAAMREVRFDRAAVPDTRAMMGEEGLADGLARLSILHRKRADIQEAWLGTWRGRGLDAVVGPGAQNTAVEHDQYGPAPYTALANFLDVCRASGAIAAIE